MPAPDSHTYPARALAAGVGGLVAGAVGAAGGVARGGVGVAGAPGRHGAKAGEGEAHSHAHVHAHGAQRPHLLLLLLLLLLRGADAAPGVPGVALPAVVCGGRGVVASVRRCMCVCVYVRVHVCVRAC